MTTSISVEYVGDLGDLSPAVPFRVKHQSVGTPLEYDVALVNVSGVRLLLISDTAIEDGCFTLLETIDQWNEFPKYALVGGLVLSDSHTLFDLTDIWPFTEDDGKLIGFGVNENGNEKPLYRFVVSGLREMCPEVEGHIENLNQLAKRYCW